MKLRPARHSPRKPQPRVVAQQPAQRQGPKIGRNDPCPCGSGQKFKKCHGAALEDGSEPDDADVVDDAALAACR